MFMLSKRLYLNRHSIVSLYYIYTPAIKWKETKTKAKTHQNPNGMTCSRQRHSNTKDLLRKSRILPPTCDKHSLMMKLRLSSNSKHTPCFRNSKRHFNLSMKFTDLNKRSLKRMIGTQFGKRSTWDRWQKKFQEWLTWRYTKLCSAIHFNVVYSTAITKRR